MPASNRDVARILNEVADLLELDGENPFRVRRYRDAARAVRNLRIELARAVAAGVDLASLPLGDLAPKVREVLETGSLGQLEELRARVPEGLAEMVTLEGLGPARALRLREVLGVEDVPALLRATQEHRVQALPDFGVRTEARLREQARMWSPTRVYLRDRVEAAALGLLGVLGGVEGVRASVAGPARRCVATVERLDVLVGAASPEPALDAVAELPGVRVASRGADRLTGTVSGVPLELVVVELGSFGSALWARTGSDGHVKEGRRRARERGVDVDGLGREADLFEALGVPSIPPELRAGRGEWEAAEAGRLPRLLERDDLRGDLHLHTTASDGGHSLEAMVDAARAAGLDYLAVTDHSPHPRVAGGMEPEALRERNRAIDELNDRLDGFRVLKGAEVDVDRGGGLDYPDEVLAELDVVVCSLHQHLHLGRREQTARVLRVLEDGRGHILGHPLARKLGKRAPVDIDLNRVFDAAAEHGWALELDSQPRRLDLDAVHAREAKRRGIPVVVSSDAHSVPELAQVRFGVEQARRAWLEPGDVLNTRSAEGLLAGLRR